MHRTLPLLLALLLLAPMSIAQGPLPGLPVQPSVEVFLDVDQAGASIDAPATYLVTVRNTSPGTDSGDDPPMDVTLEVSGAQQGWLASLERSNFQIPAGGSETTTLTVSVGPSATVRTVTITVEATIQAGAPPFEQRATDSDQVDVSRDDSARRDATETFGDYLWVIVLGGIGLYIVSTLLLISLFRKRDREGQRVKKDEKK